MANERKTEQLGINVGTATHKLRKEILFHYIKKAGDNFCFQCGAEIETPDEFSIEHKIPWLDSDDPLSLFFDLNNISFSHLSCNIGAARRLKGNHGSHRQYRNGCRCNICKEGQRLMRKKWRDKKKKKNTDIAQLVEHLPDTE